LGSKNRILFANSLKKDIFADTGIRNALINNLNPMNLRQGFKVSARLPARLNNEFSKKSIDFKE